VQFENDPDNFVEIEKKLKANLEGIYQLI
jgi:hypothetical protein